MLVSHLLFLFLAGWLKVVLETDPKNRITVEQPDIRVLKMSTSMTVISGQPVLLSFNKLQEPAGKVEVFILKTTVVTGGGKESGGARPKPAKKRQGKIKAQSARAILTFNFEL